MSWETIKLGDYIETLTDYHANGAYKKLKANVKLKYKPDYALMIRTLNFEQNDFSSNLIWLNETEYNFLSKSKVYPDDIIMNKIANAGSVYIMPNLNRPVSLAMNLFLIRFKELNQRFMYYLMKTNEPYIKSFANGVATQSITKDAVRNLEFKIPNNTTQKKIASILSAYDDLIENNLKRIKLLEEAAQRLYKEWFVDFKFPNYENTPINPETGLPDGWEMKKLSNVCHQISSGGTPKRSNKEFWENGDIPWIKTKELRDGYIIDNEEYITKEGLEKSSAKLFDENSIVMAIYASPTLGRLGILSKKSSFNQAMVGFNINKAIITKEFLFYNLIAERKNLNNKAIGAAQQNINVKKVKEHEIIYPNLNLIKEYSNKTNCSFNLIENLSIQNQNLKEARDLLLPRLMNRTIEV